MEYTSFRADDTFSVAVIARLLSGDSEGGEENPLWGTEISVEAFEKSTAILRRVLGFGDKGMRVPRNVGPLSIEYLTAPSTSTRPTL